MSTSAPAGEAMNRRHPADPWPKAVRDVRVRRAGGRCECVADCPAKGHTVGERCLAKHEEWMPCEPAPRQVAVLDVIPLDGNRTNIDRDNLIAVCQRCKPAHLTKAEAVDVDVEEESGLW